ncbi:MAG: NAD-dependent epimerase/dehydratase family protein [Umezawaea sp.]
MSHGLRCTGAAPVVVGANGFIGARLCEAFQDSGTGRLTREQPAVLDSGLHPALSGADVVFYLATTINPALADQYPERVRADQDMFVRLLDGLAGLADPPLVVYPSSGGAIYDPSAPLPFVERGTPAVPVTAYGRAKLVMEKELRRRQDAVPSVILRLSNVYGPGQLPIRGQGVVAHWMHAMLTGQQIRLFGDPGAIRDYVYVDDVVEAMLDVRGMWLAGESLPPVMNIGSGEQTSLQDLVQAVQTAMAEAMRVETAPGRKFDRRDAVLDVGLAADTLGWRPRTKLADGLAASWAWISGPGFARANSAVEAER